MWWEDLEKKAIEKYKREVYNSSLWKMARNAVLSEQPFCVHCTEQGRTRAAVDVDHIKDLTSIYRTQDWDKAFDLDNLQGLCKQCHGTKTRKQ